jgi:NADH-quinone oxidoreductase subunit F
MKSIEELTNIKESMQAMLKIRGGLASAHDEIHILVCGGQGCISSQCGEVVEALREAVDKHHLGGKVKIVTTGCMGPCDMGPVAIVYPDTTFYKRLKPKHAELIVTEHLLQGTPVKRLLYTARGEKTPTPSFHDIDLFKKQERIVLRNMNYIDPLSIEEYIGREGYAALGKAVTAMTPGQVIAAVKDSGLRGRGGAGFPSGLKWAFTAAAKATPKYVVCNGDEGDPGAFMDRSVLEGDPHSIIEGMAIGGYAIGAAQGYVYVRAEYPLAIERLTHALENARRLGLLGENIFGSGFAFDIEIRIGAGAFVCGEETALLRSIEGKRGEPRPRPPFPAISGAFGKPTVINNVETWANIAPIISKGADWFASIGSERSKGTKVFALAGRINNTGIVEVPMGITLREIVFDIGGGIPKNKAFKAVQTGGPSGGCIPAEHLDTPIDYDSLGALGAIMGSGGMIVLDENTCMVDIAKFFLDFCVDESCGKCAPCRIGVKRMHEILERICDGQGREGDIEALIELGNIIKITALCGLGQTAPNPVLSTIRYFKHEYEAHIRDKKCGAGICECGAAAVSQDDTPVTRQSVEV